VSHAYEITYHPASCHSHLEVPDMITDRPGGSEEHPAAVTDAAWNAVAIASLAYQREVATLSTVLSTACGHGLTVDDLCAASGLDAPFVRRLLGETRR
jgi:hypothetical protein